MSEFQRSQSANLHMDLAVFFVEVWSFNILPTFKTFMIELSNYIQIQTVVDGPYAGDYYAMDGTYGTQTTAVTGGCLYRC